MGFSLRFGLALLMLLVLVTDSKSVRLLGCFKEISIEARLLSGVHQNFKNTLTPEKCISFCQGKGFLYAGVQHSYECHCSKIRPSFIHSADISDCSSRCDGDRTKICGGNFRLNVYDIADKPVNYVQPNYIGCFADDASSRRALTGKVAPESNLMTPELCVGFCFRNGYRYAGVQYRNQCYCGEEPVGPRSSEGDCDMECAGDSRFLCGGEWRNSVYHTSISDESEDGKLFGCFVDSESFRLLSGFRLDLPETNSPRRCMNICKQQGFKYAGVEYGVECHCGNRKPEKEKETNENECLTTCPNGIRKCGGNWRSLIYSTVSVQPEVLSAPNIVVARPGSSGNQPPTALVLGTGGVGGAQVLTINSQRTTTSTTRRPTVAPTRKTTPRNTYVTQPSPKPCTRSHTQVQGKTVCQGDILFHDSFLGNSLNSNVWNHEVFMPAEPNYEFVVFDNNHQSAYTSNGRLHLKLSLLEDDFVRSGRLELHKCTGRLYTDECVREAKAFSILPPIQSARITTKNFVNFKYGKVVVRAKLPLGDWIIPEIWLEPKRKIYGPSYASGRIRLAVARGNKDLITENGENIGNIMLLSGILMGTSDKVLGRTVLEENPEGWSSQFHNYTLIWGPDNISFMVDRGEREELISVDGRRLSEILGFDYYESNIWQNGSSIAPFDQEFYLSLGLSVGGMKDFPDGCYSGGRIKPWRNEAVKAMVNFWQDRKFWLSTWKDAQSEFQIEHVTIYAL